MRREEEGRHAVRAQPAERLRRAGVHRDPRGVEVAEVGQCGLDLCSGGAADGSADHEDVAVRAGDPAPPRSAGGGRCGRGRPVWRPRRPPERRRRARASRRREPAPRPGCATTSTSSSPTAITETRGPRVHQHLVAAGRRRACRPGPGRARRRAGRRRRRAARPRRPPHERRGRHAARHRELGRAAVGVADGHHRVGERGQRRPAATTARPARAAGAADAAIRPGSPRRRAARRGSARSAPERSTLRTA